MGGGWYMWKGEPRGVRIFFDDLLREGFKNDPWNRVGSYFF